MRSRTPFPVVRTAAALHTLLRQPGRSTPRRPARALGTLTARLAVLIMATPLVAASQPAPNRLAFQRDGAVWVAAANGSGAVKLVDGVDPRIAPDGLRIAYTKDTSAARGVHRYIAIVDIATRASRVLTSVPSDNSFGSEWSPDGSSLLVYVLADQQWNLGLVKANDTAFRYVVKPGPGVPSCWSAAWAPDGASIFCQDLESLFRLSLDGKRLWKASVAQLFPKGDLNSGARIAPSPDGRRLLVEVDMDEATTVRTWDGPPPTVFLVELDEKTSKRFTAPGLVAWQPEWLDATDFLCIIERQGDTEPSVARIPLAGGAPTLLVRNARQPSVSAPPNS